MSDPQDTDFDDWLRDHLARMAGFTMLIVLIGTTGGRIDLLRSAFLHVIGNELAWGDLEGHFDGAGMTWDAAALFLADRDAMVSDDVAHERLDILVRALNGDRGLIREGGFFNRDGMALRLDDADPQPPVFN